jgi:hypothetical protein
VEDRSEAWIKHASASSTEVVDVVTGTSMGSSYSTCDASFPGSAIITEVVSLVL